MTVIVAARRRQRVLVGAVIDRLIPVRTSVMVKAIAVASHPISFASKVLKEPVSSHKPVSSVLKAGPREPLPTYDNGSAKVDVSSLFLKGRSTPAESATRDKGDDAARNIENVPTAKNAKNHERTGKKIEAVVTSGARE